jgi:hypothetical protein
MTTKKQKRLAGEARAMERDAAHEAAIKERARIADARKRRKEQRAMRQARQASTVAAVSKMRPKEES